PAHRARNQRAHQQRRLHVGDLRAVELQRRGRSAIAAPFQPERERSAPRGRLHAAANGRRRRRSDRTQPAQPHLKNDRHAGSRHRRRGSGGGAGGGGLGGSGAGGRGRLPASGSMAMVIASSIADASSRQSLSRDTSLRSAGGLPSAPAIWIRASSARPVRVTAAETTSGARSSNGS